MLPTDGRIRGLVLKEPDFLAGLWFNTLLEHYVTKSVGVIDNYYITELVNSENLGLYFELSRAFSKDFHILKLFPKNSGIGVERLASLRPPDAREVLIVATPISGLFPRYIPARVVIRRMRISPECAALEFPIIYEYEGTFFTILCTSESFEEGGPEQEIRIWHLEFEGWEPRTGTFYELEKEGGLRPVNPSEMNIYGNSRIMLVKRVVDFVDPLERWT
ncbi:MAG: hypothetical protein ACTSXJ_05385 [Candidatus Baldrarchaeia archaeon]